MPTDASYPFLCPPVLTNLALPGHPAKRFQTPSAHDHLDSANADVWVQSATSGWERR